MWPVPLAQVLPRPQLIFSSKTWFFGIYWNFQSQKSVKSQDFPHSGSKSYQINSIKSCSSRSNNTKTHSNSSKIFSYDLISFSVKKIIQYSRTFVPQVQTSWNQAHAPLLVKSFQRHQEHNLKHPGLVNLIVTKQTTFIDKWQSLPSN